MAAGGKIVDQEKYASGDKGFTSIFTRIKATKFQVNQTKIANLIGSNGAGKSTALKTVFGLLRPKQGKFASTAKT